VALYASRAMATFEDLHITGSADLRCESMPRLENQVDAVGAASDGAGRS
jgi:hypothetical protein